MSEARTFLSAASTITRCRSCGGPVEPVLDLGDFFLNDFPEPGNARRGLRVPLTLVKCATCQLVQLRHTVKPEKMFSHFWYQSAISSTMQDALGDVVQKALTAAGRLNEDDVVVDIGCNDGTLMRQYPNPPWLNKIGFEPALNVASKAAGACTLIPDYFNSAAYFRVTKQKAKILTSIAMFYDLDDPNGFVDDVRSILDPDGVWVLQMNYLGSMLRNNCYDNICHEHLEYYSLTSLKHLLDRHGLEVFRVEENDVNGGSFRVYSGFPGRHPVEGSVMDMLREEAAQAFDNKAPFDSFKQRIEGLRTRLQDLLEGLTGTGKKVYIYGASTRGNTLLQYCGLDWLPAATDANPEKWGRVTVGTGIPIISKYQARQEKPDCFLVLPYHFLDEILREEREFREAGGKFIVPLPKVRVIE